MAAAERGASVTVFEKTGTVGGAANMGMGFAVNSGRMAGYNAVEFLDAYEFED